MLPDNLHILILGGRPKEFIDGVRYFANVTYPETLGAEAAKLLAAQDAKVTLITPDASTISASDLINAAEQCARQDIKAVLQLANISSIRPAKISAQKLKVKKEIWHIPMEVVGNVDIWTRLETAFPGIPVIGYRNNQLRITIDNPTAKALVTVLPAQAISSPSWPESRSDSKAIQPHSKNWITLESLRDSGDDEALAGRKVIITAGPTVEKLAVQGDIITNISSGKQGYAIAEALAGMGAQVTLVTGPTALPDPVHPCIHTQHVISARDMYRVVMASLPADAYIGVAAVADFGIENPLDISLKEDEPYTLPLAQNPDILHSVGMHPTLRPQAVIGFAAETNREKLVEYARAKLISKGADAICANLAGAAGSNRNQIIWVTKNGAESWEVMEKHAIGYAISRKLTRMLDQCGVI